MLRSVLMALGLLLLVPGLIWLTPSVGAGDDEVRPVRVINFPETQNVQGRVSIEGTLRQAALTSLREIEVPPVGPSDPRKLISAGVITTDGFGAVVMSLSGSTKGRAPRPGEVGALLIPDEEPILRLMEEQGVLQFALEVKAPVALNNPIFSSAQERRLVGFPRYRVLLYNTSDRTVTVDLFAYLTM